MKKLIMLFALSCFLFASDANALTVYRSIMDTIDVFTEIPIRDSISADTIYIQHPENNEYKIIFLKLANPGEYFEIEIYNMPKKYVIYTYRILPFDSNQFGRIKPNKFTQGNLVRIKRNEETQFVWVFFETIYPQSQKPTLSGPTELCVGSTYTFAATGSDDAKIYTWGPYHIGKVLTGALNLDIEHFSLNEKRDTLKWSIELLEFSRVKQRDTISLIVTTYLRQGDPKPNSDTLIVYINETPQTPIIIGEKSPYWGENKTYKKEPQKHQEWDWEKWIPKLDWEWSYDQSQITKEVFQTPDSIGFEFLQSGTLNLTLTASNGGCKTSSTLEIEVKNRTNKPVVSKENKVYLYPTRNHISFISDSEIKEIKIVNLQGQTIFVQDKINSKVGSISHNVSNNYLALITLQSGEIITKKISIK